MTVYRATALVEAPHKIACKHSSIRPPFLLRIPWLVHGHFCHVDSYSWGAQQLRIFRALDIYSQINMLRFSTRLLVMHIAPHTSGSHIPGLSRRIQLVRRVYDLTP